MITNQTLKLFPEPVFKYKFDNPKELNTELSKYIYDLRDKDAKGLKRSNKGGWHSQNFKLTEKGLDEKNRLCTLAGLNIKYQSEEKEKSNGTG